MENQDCRINGKTSEKVSEELEKIIFLLLKKDFQ